MSYAVDQAVELGTLTLLVGREARGCPYSAMLGVAWSVRNRVFKPRYWGTDWLSVMSFKYAYSSLTANADPNLIVYPNLEKKEWQAAAQAAETAYLGSGPDPISAATHYYSIDIDPPAWAKAPDTVFVTQIDRFKFFQAY